MTTPSPVTVAADYLGGHPGEVTPVMDGELTVDGTAVRFTGSRLEVLTPTRVEVEVPARDIRALSSLARGDVDPVASLVRAAAMFGALGAFMHRPGTQRDRMLVLGMPGGGAAAFALTTVAASRVTAAIDAMCGTLPEALPADARGATDTEILIEIRDLLARQVQLLEWLTARLAT